MTPRSGPIYEVYRAGQKWPSKQIEELNYFDKESIPNKNKNLWSIICEKDIIVIDLKSKVNTIEENI